MAHAHAMLARLCADGSPTTAPATTRVRRARSSLGAEPCTLARAHMVMETCCHSKCSAMSGRSIRCPTPRSSAASCTRILLKACSSCTASRPLKVCRTSGSSTCTG